MIGKMIYSDMVKVIRQNNVFAFNTGHISNDRSVAGAHLSVCS